ncbi:MAG: glycoside hydrolase family protein, partial [Alphaproteobacteria bacterium]|nr:glycoside hydrolase family protein [Alphaproteobacteria bacterium]
MSDTPKPTKISREGIILIKSFEGFRPRAVQRADGRWTIGYGHTRSAREGLSVSESDAELLLQYDLIPVVRAIGSVHAPLNQHQFDALASFALSIGVERFLGSDVLQRVNDGLLIQAADDPFVFRHSVPEPDELAPATELELH